VFEVITADRCRRFDFNTDKKAAAVDQDVNLALVSNLWSCPVLVPVSFEQCLL
jgi:hypothetical protein